VAAETYLDLILEGIEAVRRNKGEDRPSAVPSTPLEELGFDSLDYAELLLHIELKLGKPVSFRAGGQMKVVHDLVRICLAERIADD
jgi:acyl carrier protein